MAGARSQPAVLARIPAMNMPKLMRLWTNAITILEDRTKKAQHSQAELVLGAIRKEWERRRFATADGDDFFKWPSTAAYGGDGKLTSAGWRDEGFLSFMGYRVGTEKGVAQHIRLRILREVVDGPLPPVFDQSYLFEWGAPGTATRLRKLAESLASFTRNAKRKKSAHMAASIRSWEYDLEYLYAEFYVGRFGFAWPSVSIM